MTEYEHKQTGVTISMLGELNTLAIKSRMDATYEQIMRNMNTTMFGDREPPKPLTRYQRWTRRARAYRERIRDAWLVLRGKADIGDSW